MKSNIETVQQFVSSLSVAQRLFFTTREKEIQARLQTSLRDLGRGISEVASINGESLQIVISHQPLNEDKKSLV